MKKKILLLIAIVIMSCCVFGVSASAGDRPYNDYYKKIDGVVYGKHYDYRSEKYYYIIVDFFETDELAEKATEITNLKSEIDGIPVTELRCFENGQTSYPNIKKIVLPDSLKVIGEESLSYYPNLKSITIPDSVTYIERQAFAGMTSLKTVVISKNVKGISEGTFSGCKNLSKVVFRGEIVSIGNLAFKNCASLKNFKIPETVTRIGGGAFMNTGLTSVTLPSGLTYFGDEDTGPVFAGCKKLKKVTFLGFKGKLLDLDATFENCTALEKVYLPKEAKRICIDFDAFRNCKKLKKVYNTTNVEIIGENAFRGCKSLTSFTISKKVNEIRKNAFYGCSKLKSVTVNSSKKAPTIGKKAFNKTAEGIKFTAKNVTAAKNWKTALKKSGLKNMKVRYVKYVNV